MFSIGPEKDLGVQSLFERIERLQNQGFVVPEEHPGIISDPHERRNDLGTVSERDSAK